MRLGLKCFALVLAALVSSSCQQNDGWEDLFNGKDLTGFVQLNGKAPYRVEDGCLIGKSVAKQPNSFMATEKTYGDFILEFEVQCDPLLNSGVQFRSESYPEYSNGRVHGYQCEIDPSKRAWSGGVFDEARRGWLAPLTDNPEGRAAYKQTGWNKYRIEAIGSSIRIWLNGVNTANLYDDMTPAGFIAFQVHGIGNAAQEGKEIRWRNIRIKTEDLDAERMQGKLAKAINKVPNTLVDEEKAEGWKLLFDGKTTNGWRGAHKEAFPEKGWKVENGELTVLSSGGAESTNGGDIVTLDEYSAFELSLEFKLTPGANSGIKYFVTEAEKVNNPRSAFGLEYQILDDKLHPDAKKYTSYEGSRTVASLYDLIKAVPENGGSKRVNAIGKWNNAVLKVFPNNRVEHWLNGFKVIEYDRCSEEYRKLVGGSKYANKIFNDPIPFGEAKSGHILLQDHGDLVSFRSIKIRTL